MKTLLFLSNLFPRPDAPRRGLFNLAFVAAMHDRLSGSGGAVCVVVPVPEWRVWRWRAIRRWTLPPEAGESLGKTVSVVYVPCFYIPMIGRSLSALWYFRSLVAMVPSVRHVDCMLASWLYPDGVAASRLAMRLAKPYWVRLHGSDRFHLDAPFRGPRCRRVLAEAEGVMVNAAFMKQELIDRGLSGHTIKMVSNGLDRDLFHTGTTADRTAQDVLWVGNMVAIKRPELAIKAFAELTAIGSNSQSKVQSCRLVMIGDGPMRGRLESLSAQMGLTEQVLLTGSLSRQDVASWMRKAKLLLLSSRSEGMPNVVIEALACGTPVVTTEVGDVRAFVHNGINGFVVKGSKGSERQLVQALAKAAGEVLAADWSSEAIAGAIPVYGWQQSATRALAYLSGDSAVSHSEDNEA